jgi:hypothetical protein
MPNRVVLLSALSLLVNAVFPVVELRAEQPSRRTDEGLRLIVETDAGGDPDDEQSLVRFLLYANEWDVEGLIANRAQARDQENLNPERTGLGIVRRLVNAYGKCHPNLVVHDSRYPEPNILLRRTVAGYEDSHDGVMLVLDAVDANDPRPIWFLNWGTDNGSASSCLKRALDRVLKERGPEGYAQFKNKLRVIGYPDFVGEHATTIDPSFPLFVNTFQPPLDGNRWYHRFSALTATAGGFDLRRDVLTGHGPLGELYPTNTTHSQKEGDTMCFLYLVPTGMNDPREPTWGSWAGRYGPHADFKHRNLFWANQADTWQGTTHRENTLARWAVDLQNDFRTRLDWCVQPIKQANHPPSVVVNGQSGRNILHVHAAPGRSLALDATGTSDPDGHPFDHEWFVYGEAGSYTGQVSIVNPSDAVASMMVPADAATQTIHVILVVRDHGTLPLARYRRVVAHCTATPAAKP